MTERARFGIVLALLSVLLPATYACCGQLQLTNRFTAVTQSPTSAPNWLGGSWFPLLNTSNSVLRDSAYGETCYSWQRSAFAASQSNYNSWRCDGRAGNRGNWQNDDDDDFACVGGNCNLYSPSCECAGLESIAIQMEVPSNYFTVQVNGVYLPSPNSQNWRFNTANPARLQWPSFIWGPTGFVSGRAQSVPSGTVKVLHPPVGATGSTYMNNLGTVLQYTFSTLSSYSDLRSTWHVSDVDEWIDATIVNPVDNPPVSTSTSNSIGTTTSSGFYSGYWSRAGFIGAYDQFITYAYNLGSGWSRREPTGAPLPTSSFNIIVNRSLSDLWKCGASQNNAVELNVWSTGEFDAPANRYGPTWNKIARGGNMLLTFSKDHTSECRRFAACTAADLTRLRLMTPDWSLPSTQYSYSQSGNTSLVAYSKRLERDHLTCNGWNPTYVFLRNKCARKSSSSSSTGSSRSVTSSFIRGDPSFIGLRGQSFQVHGIDGAVYNIISDAQFQLNSRFVFLQGPRPCPIIPSTGKRSVACWSHDGSYLSNLAVHTNAGDRVYIEAGSAEEGFISVTVNNQDFAPGDMAELLFSDQNRTGFLHFVNPYEILLLLGAFQIEIESSDEFLNLRSVGVNEDEWADLRSHGLLGQTWRYKVYPKNEVKYVAGHVDDYIVEDDDMFGNSFPFNQFRVLTTRDPAEEPTTNKLQPIKQSIDSDLGEQAHDGQ